MGNPWASAWGISLIDDWCERAEITVEDTVPPFMILCAIRKQVTACYYTERTKR